MLRMISVCVVVGLFACADEPRGDLVLPAADGKADAADRVERKGALGFGTAAAVTGAFVEDLSWQGFDLKVRPGAVVKLEVTQKGSARNLDSVLFVYGPKTATGFGTTAYAFDDDSGWGRLSRLSRLALAGGEWLVVVGTRDARGRGAYRIEATCESGECAPVVVAGGCDAAIQTAIEACVAGWLADPDFDPSRTTREDLIAQCADAEPMAGPRDRRCAEAGAPAELCAIDMEAFQVSYLPVCRRAVVGRWLDAACVFGEQYHDLFSRAEAITILGQRKIVSADQASALEAAQIVDAVHATAYDEVTTLAQALDAVDENEVNQTQIWDASHRKAYTVYEVGAGDNSFGRVFAFGTTKAVATNNDGDWYECKVTWGPERRRCESDSECAAGLRCVGRTEASPLGRCIDTATVVAGVGVECGTATPCLTGLACAGASINGAGVCVPGWMRGAFTSEPEQSIPDGDARGVTTSLLAFGLATVSTDVLLDLAIEHPRPEDLRVTLTNPAGTEVVIQDGQGAEIWFSRRAIRGFPGDESVNGAWQLTVADKVRGTTGIIHRFGLELTSRWD